MTETHRWQAKCDRALAEEKTPSISTGSITPTPGSWANVAKHNCSSWAMACRVRALGGDFFAESGYRTADSAIAGGAVPLRVRGSLIGAVGVSGLAEEDDHRVVIAAMRAHLAR